MTATIKIAGEQGSEPFVEKVYCPFTLEVDGECFTIRSRGKIPTSGEYGKGDKVEITFE